MKAPRDDRTSQRVKYSFLKILTGSDLSRRRLPFMSVDSVKSGPVIWLTGCMHGDEVTGIVTIQEVFKVIRRQCLLCGAVYAFPLMNPIGFETGSRNITLSREDLNRSFPGNKDGSLAERIADKILATIRQTNPTLVLDLHNDWMKSIPYTLIDPYPNSGHKQAYQTAMIIAGKSGFPVVMETDDVTSSLSYSLLQQGIPALTIELGESYVVNENNVKRGVTSVLGILEHFGIIEATNGAVSSQASNAQDQKPFRFSFGPVSSASGIIRFLAKPGDVVKKGQAVAKIYNTFGKLQDTVRCDADGIVLGHSDSSVAYPGAPVMSFGIV